MTLRILRENFAASPPMPTSCLIRLLALIKRAQKLCHTK